MTVEELRAAETRYQEAARVAEEARAARNAAVHEALLCGWRQRDVSAVMGLSAGRIGQLAQGLERVYRRRD